MRNGDDSRAAEGPKPDDGARGVDSSWAVLWRTRRRKQAIAGAVGVLSILGVGGLVANQVIDDRDTAPSSQTGALEPMAPGAQSPPGGVAPPVLAGPSASTQAGLASTTAHPVTPIPKSSAKRVAAARSAVASASLQVRRPLPAPDTGTATVSEADVTTTTVRRGGETVQVKSGLRDLTGYRELGWIVDKGKKVGNVRCTQRIRLSPSVKARVRPTLLLCWRTSAQKSVYTVAVKMGGRPSMKASAAEIDKEWTKLG